MIKRMISAVIAITLVMGMCSCGEQSSSQQPANNNSSSQTDPQPRSEPEEEIQDTGRDTIELTADHAFSPADEQGKNDADFIESLNGFSVELFKNTVKSDLTNDGKNTLISGESVAYALGMTMNGANGSTLSQMQNVLSGNVDLNRFNKNMNLLISNANRNNTDESRISIANSVWVRDRQDLVLNDQFAKNCKQMYNADLFRSPFDRSTVEKLNSWVSKKTDKMIPKLIDTLSPLEVMCLVNCVAFDSEWEKQYEDEQVKDDMEFTNSKDEKVDCTMLCSTEKNYVENSKAKGFVKYYKGGKYAFMAVLPNEEMTISDYVSSMKKDEIAQLFNSKTTRYKVITRLPKFKFDYSTEMGDTLTKMGMGEAFSNAADFSNMFTSEDVAINRVIHKTHIELDAKGTKAAASTAVTMRAKGEISQQNKTVFLDRPFVFAIMDTEAGVPVFMGTVCDPTQN